MGKLPAFLFYPSDWTRDLEEHSFEIRGVWITLLCVLWWSDEKGVLVKTLPKIAKLLHVRTEKAHKLVQYLQKENIADIPTDLARIDKNTLITIRSRRMVSDEKKRESDRKRKEKQRRNVTD